MLLRTESASIPSKMRQIDPILAVEIEEAKEIIAAIRPRPLTIQERMELLEDRMSIDGDEAHELVYQVAGWHTG
jgi:hypothetical protein